MTSVMEHLYIFLFCPYDSLFHTLLLICVIYYFKCTAAAAGEHLSRVKCNHFFGRARGFNCSCSPTSSLFQLNDVMKCNISLYLVSI